MIASAVRPVKTRAITAFGLAVTASTSPPDRQFAALAEFSAPHIGDGVLPETAETPAAFGFIPSLSAFRRAQIVSKSLEGSLPAHYFTARMIDSTKNRNR